MANVYSLAFTAVGTVIAHCCLLVWTALLLPRPVERARHRIESRPLASFLLGLLVSLVTTSAVAGFFLIRIQSVVWFDDALEFLKVHLRFSRFYNDAWIITNGVTWFLMIPLLMTTIVGGAGFAQMFAVRARPLMKEDGPLMGLVLGAFCTSAAYLLPIIGWFVFLPIVGLMSIGAGAWGIVSRDQPKTADSFESNRNLPEPAGSLR